MQYAKETASLEAAGLAPAAHHPRGMSKWPAVFACPRFTSCETGEAAASASLGTETHAFLARILSHMRDHDGQMPDFVDGAHVLTRWENGAVAVASAIRDEILADTNGKDLSRILIERRCTLPDGVFGTCDCAYVDEQERAVFVWDFKTFCNPCRDYTQQLQGYALSLMRDSSYSARIEVLYGDGSAKSRKTFHYSKCWAAYRKAMSIFDERDNGTAEPKQCAWCELCANAPTCPAVVSLVEKAGTAMAEQACGKKTPTSATFKELAKTAENAISGMTTERLVKWCFTIDFLAKVGSSMREELKRRIEASGKDTASDPATGAQYELSDCRGRSSVEFIKACDLARRRNLPPDRFHDACKVSASALAKLLVDSGLSQRDADAEVSVCSVSGGEPYKVLRRV